MSSVTDKLQSEFGKLQAKFRTVSNTHIKDLQTELTTWQRDGLITKKFYEQNYGPFVFHPPETLENARSIVIVGIPQKITPVKFFYNGKRYHTILPPTYIFSEVRAACKEILSRILNKEGYSVETAILPLKLLAVKSGLGKYGKNNLCYVDGSGSFTRLQAFYTDYKFPIDDWGEKEIMDPCKKCSLCQNACPTHCIPNERILIHADQCLSHFNENEGDFPSWITKQSHNALVGCMHCQIICPQNKKYLEFNRKTITFTETEISLILQKTPRDQIPQALAKKLVDFDIDEYYPQLQRNLTVLINK
jgi:epoxyqueuosine reductase